MKNKKKWIIIGIILIVAICLGISLNEICGNIIKSSFELPL